MFDWNEIKSVEAVARLGSVSSAARELEVHRATVIRHIATLELKLGRKLFTRHAKGYRATDLGMDLLRIGTSMREDLSRFQVLAKERADVATGDLIVTSVDALAPVLMPAFQRMQDEHPGVRIKYIGTAEPLSLSEGEAHIAIRAGDKPTDQDCHVEHLHQFKVALFASKQYAERYGVPETTADFSAHRFSAPDFTRSHIAAFAWIQDHAPEKAISFVSSSIFAREVAVTAGNAIGLMPTEVGDAHPLLVPVMPDLSWDVDHWLVAHIDLYDTPKVTAFAALVRHHFKQDHPFEMKLRTQLNCELNER